MEGNNCPDKGFLAATLSKAVLLRFYGAKGRGEWPTYAAGLINPGGNGSSKGDFNRRRDWRRENRRAGAIGDLIKPLRGQRRISPRPVSLRTPHLDRAADVSPPHIDSRQTLPTLKEV